MCVRGCATRLTLVLALLIGCVFQYPTCGRGLDFSSFEEESDGTSSYRLDCDAK